MRVAAIILLALGALETAGAARPAPCDEMAADCRRTDSVQTRAGRIELYEAHDLRSQTPSPARIKNGEYLMMYALHAPGTSEPVIAAFEEGENPNAHHYEICGSDSDWCTRIVRSTAILSANRQGVVTLVVKTSLVSQRWGADVGVRAKIVQRRRSVTRTVRCARADAAWQCTITPDPT